MPLEDSPALEVAVIVAILFVLAVPLLWPALRRAVQADRRCPHCRMAIPQDAVVCGHCQRDL